MTKKKDLSQEDKETWEKFTKQPSNIYDKEQDNKNFFLNKGRLKFDLHGFSLKDANKKVNELIIKASKSRNLKNILTTNNLPLVSIDFNHNPSSSIFDLTQTQVLNGNFCRVLSWYDNEWGFSNRMIDTMLDFKKLL